MKNEDSVQTFLNEFKMKLGIWGVLFRDDRGKNLQTLLDLEITTEFRKKVLMDLAVNDYCEGPVDDTLYGEASLWVFGKVIKTRDVYIKITMGQHGSKVICISFHLAERKLKYQFK